MAFIKKARGDTIAAEQELTSLVQECRFSSDQAVFATCLNDLAELHFLRGEFGKATELFMEAVAAAAGEIEVEPPGETEDILPHVEKGRRLDGQSAVDHVLRNFGPPLQRERASRPPRCRRTLMRTPTVLSEGGYGCGYLSRDSGTHTGGRKHRIVRERENPA